MTNTDVLLLYVMVALVSWVGGYVVGRLHRGGTDGD